MALTLAKAFSACLRLYSVLASFSLRRLVKAVGTNVLNEWELELECDPELLFDLIVRERKGLRS